MTSSEAAIVLRGVRKVYRLYDGPRQRLLDVLGLLPRSWQPRREHVALDDVNAQIRRGEKVAVIGRNGAGKSTLLKLLSGVIEPTAGDVRVSGRIHPLLQLGTGFHPEFTGRQNAIAYFEQLGTPRADQARLLEEVIDFAELEEYIDQPVKTYSTGMAVRLMFATATALVPDLLLLDEILGVGDAYFTQKSFGRVDALCRSSNTTLMLVTHDLYSAARLCDRVLWIDRGRIVMDDAVSVVVRAYEDSIRVQEEARLQARARRRVLPLEAAADGNRAVLVEFRPAPSTPFAAPVNFGRIDLLVGGVVVGRMEPGTATGARGRTFVDTESSSWGSIVRVDGRDSLPFLNYGSPFRKAMLAFASDAPIEVSDPSDVGVRFEYHVAQPFSIVPTVVVGTSTIACAPQALVPDRWCSAASLGMSVSSSMTPAALTSPGQYGTGAIALTSIVSVDAAGNEAHVFEHGTAFEMRLGYRVHDPALRERVQLLVAFVRDGVEDVCRVTTGDLPFDAVHRSGAIVLRLPRLPLANGRYAISVMVAREGYYDRAQTRYFSVNPEVYACWSQALEIVVERGGGAATGTAVVVQGDWTVLPDRAEAPVEATK